MGDATSHTHTHTHTHTHKNTITSEGNPPAIRIN